MPSPMNKVYLVLSISFLPFALGLNSTSQTGTPSLPITQDPDISTASNILIPNAGKCEEVLYEICPPTQPGCEGTTLSCPANQDSWHPINNDGVDRVQRPKVLSCLELVRDGKLNVTDAFETMKELGLNDVDGVVDQAQSEEMPEGLLNVGQLQDNEMDLGMMLRLLGGLGLQIPPDQEGDGTTPGLGMGELGGMLKMLAPVEGSVEGSVEEDSVNNDIPEAEKLTFEEILAVMEAYEKGENNESGEKEEETAEDGSNTMEWIYQHDPEAANGELAPFLKAMKASGMAKIETGETRLD
jgi:hypothetical protein